MTDRSIPEGLQILDSEPAEVKNPYTGEAVTLEPDALAVYDMIKGSEAMNYHEYVREGLDWFRVNEPKAYYILLD
tara:strand:- start:773 stop:997 length:225 start_codon:yes stop_codon:yes gene_type:complete